MERGSTAPGERAPGGRAPATDWQLLGKGRTPTFRTHISPPAGQSSPALLAVLLGEERSALLMAMNSSRLFIQPSSACWLQPQPAPPHGMTPPGNNALPGNSPLRLRTLRDTSAAPLRSLPSPLTHCSEHPLPPAERAKPGPTGQCHPQRATGPENQWLENTHT